AVALREVGLGQALAPAGAFGDIEAGELEMDPARPGSCRGVAFEVAAHFLEDSLEVAGLEAFRRAGRVAVPGSAAPPDGMPLARPRLEQRRQDVTHPGGAHAADQDEATRLAVGIDRRPQGPGLFRRRARTELDADRIVDAAQELDVRAVGLAGALADPEHVRRAGIPAPTGGFATGERLFVRQVQGLVRGEELDLVELRRIERPEAAGIEEGQRLRDATGELGVALALRAARDELGGPAMDAPQVRISAARERAQQVEGGRRMRIGAQEPRRVGAA